MSTNYTDKMMWVRPDVTISLVDHLVSERGETEESISKAKEFDKTREGWIASVFALAKTSLERRVWYLRQNEVQDSATDILALPIDYQSGVPTSTGQEHIQITRITKYSPARLIESLKKKFKQDLRGVSLVVYVIRREVINWEEVSMQVVSLNPLVKDITIIGDIAPRKFIVGQVYPTVLVTEVDLDNLKMPSQAEKMIVGTHVSRENEAGITKEGEALLTPDFRIEKLTP